jgi:hypothetical protein
MDAIGRMQVVELYKAADKYEVLGLLAECAAAFRALTGAAEVAPLLQARPRAHADSSLM